MVRGFGYISPANIALKLYNVWYSTEGCGGIFRNCPWEPSPLKFSGRINVKHEVNLNDFSSIKDNIYSSK